MWDTRRFRGSRSLADTEQSPSELRGPDCFRRGAARCAELQSSSSVDVFPHSPLPVRRVLPRRPLFRGVPGAEPWAVTFCRPPRLPLPRMRAVMEPCGEVCVCVSLPTGASLTSCQPPHPARGPAGTSGLRRERGTGTANNARSWHGLQRLARGLVAEGSRRGCSVHMLQGAWLRRSLALELCLVIGEDFTSGGAGAGLPWVFKLCLCVAAWQTWTVTRSVS